LYSKESREINVGHFRHVSLQLIIVFRVADDLDWDLAFGFSFSTAFRAERGYLIPSFIRKQIETLDWKDILTREQSHSRVLHVCTNNMQHPLCNYGVSYRVVM